MNGDYGHVLVTKGIIIPHPFNICLAQLDIRGGDLYQIIKKVRARSRNPDLRGGEAQAFQVDQQLDRKAG